MKFFPLILSSPSGAGKTTIARRLLASRSDVGYSVSCTTRAPRPGEVDGTDYYFWGESQFAEARDRGEFAEWALVHGALYGTLRAEVDRVLGSGRHVILDIDVQGAGQLLEVYPAAVSVFILPPSVEEMVRRLRARASEDWTGLRIRLESARAELLKVGMYDYVVVNEDLTRALGNVAAIIDAESHRRVRSFGLLDRISQLSADLRLQIEAVS
jgi:guanylate kinase